MANEEDFRRIGDISGMEVRIRMLEAKSLELTENHKHHDGMIERLLEQDKDAVIALNSINLKFDALLSKFSFGFGLVCTGSTVIVVLIGGFWTYTHDLDARYAPKFNQIMSNTESKQKHVEIDIEAELDKIKDIQKKLDRLQRLKVIKSSK